MPNKELGIADPVYDALRIRSGQSIAPDLGGGSTGGSGLENKIQVWHADGSAIDLFDATETGLNSALAAAASGDTIWLPSINIALTAAITIPANITLTGISGQAQLSFGSLGSAAIVLSSASVLDRLFVTQAANDAVDLVLIQAPTSGTGYIGHCAVQCVQSGSGDATALLGSTGLLSVKDTSISAQTISGTPICASASAADTVYLEDCNIAATQNGSAVSPFPAVAESLVDTLSIVGTNAAYQSGAYTTLITKSYRVEVTGTIQYHSPTPALQSDAGNNTNDNWSTHAPALSFQLSNGSFPTTTDAYNVGHVYNFILPGTGAVFSARYGDSAYTDNAGTWSVAVYELSTSLVNLEGCVLNGNWLGISEWGDRSVRDAFVYPDRHTNDIDNGIHWTRAELESMFAGPTYWYNVKTYGAAGDGTADDTAAVQAAIDAAHAANGLVYFPPGVYSCSNLIGYANATMKGDGIGTSTIKARSGGSLYSCQETATLAGGLNIFDLTFDGDNTAAIGVDLRGMYVMALGRVIITKCTSIGLKLRGVLVSHFYDFMCVDCPIGLDVDSVTQSSYGFLPSNLNLFERFALNTCSTWGMKHLGGSLIEIQAGDIENCGTTANAATGGIYFQTAIAADVIGFHIHDTWFERNKGGTSLKIDTPSTAYVGNTIDNSNFELEETTYGIYVEGAVRDNLLVCTNTRFYNDCVTADFYANGADAQIDLHYCTGTTGGAGTINSYPPYGSSGTVTSIAAGTGITLTPDPIVATGTIAQASTAVTPGSYKTANITVDQQGNLTAAANGALDDLSDVDTTGTGTGDVIYNSGGTWEDYPLGLGSRITSSGSKIRFGNVAGGNYLEIDSVTGTLRLVGDATTYDDFRVEASVVKPGATAPNWKAFGPSGNLQALMFEASHHDEAYFEMQLPHNWKLGTNIYPHVHWTPVNTTAGNVVWELEYSWANVGDAFGAPGNMATDATAAGGVAWVHKLTDFKESGNNYINGAGKTLSSMLSCRLHRNSNAGSDTLNQDVALLEVDFHYQIDSLGSDEPMVKDASASLLLETGDILLLETGDRLLTE